MEQSLFCVAFDASMAVAFVGNTHAFSNGFTPVIGLSIGVMGRDASMCCEIRFSFKQ
jgi:hypothetical protein